MIIKQTLFALLLLCSALFTAQAQGLESKLEEQTDFIPQAAAPVEQLKEVAEKFRIPTGIEWLEDSKSNKQPAGAFYIEPRKRSVRELIRAILGQSPAHFAEVEGKILHIYAPSVVSHPFNFLNLRLDSYSTEKQNLFDAEAHLRTLINLHLYPELFKNGYGGGYGHPGNDIFSIPNISIEAQGVTIREVLNRIAVENGNALWIVELKPVEFAGKRPYWQGQPLNDYGHSPINSRWHFYPLADIKELAKEQVVVEFSVAGFEGKERIAVPVIAEYGLSHLENGYKGVFTDKGNYYGYGVSVEEVRKDVVVLKLEIKHARASEAEKILKETLTVKRDKVIELHREDGINIRAYFETR